MMIKNLFRNCFSIFIAIFMISCNTDQENIEMSDVEKPTTPINLVSSEITKNSFQVAWKASTDNVAVKEYTIYLDNVKFTTTKTKYTFEGLKVDTSYNIYIEANDAAGNTSKSSSILTVKTLIPKVDIYVSGNSKYLKNGVIYELESVSGFSSSGNLINVSEGNVYSAGSIDRTSQQIAAFWKNGKINLLEPSNSTFFSTAEDMAVLGNDVYVSGSITQYSPFNYYKCYWKNGVKTILEGSNYNGSYSQPAKSVMKIAKGDVYIASQNYKNIYNPVFWKNGVMESLSFSLPINSVDINCIDVENADVYIGGLALDVSNTQIGFYWKNKVFHKVDGCQQVSAIDVVGSDVYIGGRTNSGTLAYWKNGIKTDIPFGTSIVNIQVVNNDVYAAAQQSTEAGTTNRIYKNGIQIYTTSNMGSSRVFAVEQ